MRFAACRAQRCVHVHAVQSRLRQASQLGHRQVLGHIDAALLHTTTASGCGGDSKAVACCGVTMQAAGLHAALAEVAEDKRAIDALPT